MSLHPKPRDGNDIRTTDPAELSSRVIDTGSADEPTNRVSNELTELDDDIAVVESFSHMVVFRTDDGLVSFDASAEMTGREVMAALRGWRNDRVHSLVYTHGHMDHVGGSGAVLADAEDRGHEPPAVIGHENVPPRLERYQFTNGWSQIINRRQFGGVSPRHRLGMRSSAPEFVPVDAAWPDTTYREQLTIEVGGLELELHHAKGETDDHTWAWVPQHKALVTGDLVLWVFPNAGNPQKVQRYPLRWAEALRTMMTYDAELLLPAHGLPIRGRDRILRVLGDIADVLETLVHDTVALMNDGARLDEIVHSVTVDPDKLGLPWLLPLYDEPEFVIRNIWRQYGGWWDANPSHLKPAPEADLALELATLAGGANVLARRAQELAEVGDFRLASHLVDFAGLAEPHDATIHEARAELYMARRRAESSLMAKGIFAAAARESQAIADPPDD